MKIFSINSGNNSTESFFLSTSSLNETILIPFMILSKRMRTQPVIELFIILFTNRDINLSLKYDPVVLNSCNLSKVDNISPVNPHKHFGG